MKKQSNFKFPDKLNICGKIYNIAYIDNEVTITDNEPSGWGLFDPFSQTLRILDSEDINAKLDTLIHEILHAIFHHNRYLRDAVGAREPSGGEKEELFVNQLASILTDTLTRNDIIKL